MPHIPSDAVHALVTQARMALGKTQDELGSALRSSRRTVGRWEGGRSTPDLHELVKLAGMVYATDPSLARKIAAEAGVTVESLGLVPRPAPAPPPLPPVPPPRPLPPTHLMVESIVCAAAEALATTPGAVRGVLRAAFGRARGMGLSVEEVDDALLPRREPTAPSTDKANKRNRGASA